MKQKWCSKAKGSSYWWWHLMRKEKDYCSSTSDALIQFWSKPALKALWKYRISFTIINLKTFCKKECSDITWREVVELDFQIKKAWKIEINAETLLNHGWFFWKHQQYGNLQKSSNRLIPSLFYFSPSLIPFLILIITLWYKSNIMTSYHS